MSGMNGERAALCSGCASTVDRCYVCRAAMYSGDAAACSLVSDGHAQWRIHGHGVCVRRYIEDKCLSELRQ